MKFPHKLFAQAGLNSTDVSDLVGVSRITGYRWMLGVDRNGVKGVGVHALLRDRLAPIIASVQAAVDAGVLPDEHIKSLPPAVRLIEYQSVIDKFSPSNR